MSDLKSLQHRAITLGVVSEIRAFLNLAVPLATAQLAQFSVGFVDTIMMGHLSTETLAAGGLASTTFQMGLTVVSGFVMSVGVLAAEAYGAGQKDRIEQMARQGLWLAFLLSLLMGLLCWQTTPILSGLQQPDVVVALAQQYFRWIAAGIFPALGFAMLRGYLSAFSIANVVTVIVVIGTLCNVSLNYLLGFGKLGFPRLELVGLGLGSSLSLWLMFALFLAYILRHPQLSRYRFWRRFYQLDRVVLLRLLAIGLPITVTMALEIGMFLAVAYMAGSLGTEVLAAHQIAFQTMALIFMVPLGMSFAVTARVGLWLGQGDLTGARRAGYVAIATAMAFLFLGAIALFFFRHAVIGLFIDLKNPQNAAVVMLAMHLLLVSIFAQMVDGIQRVAMSALYGLQDTRVPMLMSAIAYWGIGLTSAYVLCFWAEWGAVGLWIGQYFGIAVGGSIFVWRFHQMTTVKG
ncbi:MAG: MATE family efflux transporter [Phormidesmis sp. RL_2_1]|nr:MATE family efflux transporter [Phormidesmis sp. RL_2_1]